MKLFLLLSTAFVVAAAASTSTKISRVGTSISPLSTRQRGRRSQSHVSSGLGLDTQPAFSKWRRRTTDVDVRAVGRSRAMEVGETTVTSSQEFREQRRDELSLDELRAQLGPIGLLVSNTIELTVTTLGSFISGGFMGYVLGGAMGVPSTLFGKDLGSFGLRLSALNTKAVASAKSWGNLSAAFSGCNGFVRLCRGGDEEDRWTNILGSFLAGAVLNKNKGPQAMLNGGATYAGFTYFIDKMFSSPSTQRARQTQEMIFDDIPLD